MVENNHYAGAHDAQLPHSRPCIDALAKRNKCVMYSSLAISVMAGSRLVSPYIHHAYQAVGLVGAKASEVVLSWVERDCSETLSV